MTRSSVTPRTFGRDVLGPVVAEFCLRLWSTVSLMERPDDTSLLFCARGGLRIQLAYERFLAASGLPPAGKVAPLMVSRLVAMRPALLRTVDENQSDLLPSAATALSYEFRRASLSEVVTALTGTPLTEWASGRDDRFTPAALGALLTSPAGVEAAAVIRDQSGLFARHLRDAMDGCSHAVLVDSGLYGTTRHLLAEGFPGTHFSSALIARSYRPGSAGPGSRTFGLSVEAGGYSPIRRRTVLLRYWHFVEWLLEPELSSVRTFVEDGGVPRSNLETDGWRDRIPPEPGTAFAGVLDYLDGLTDRPAERVVADADAAWSELHRAVVWPDRPHAIALAVGSRSHDFGLDGSWSQRPWRGPFAALRGSSMWREGEIARSGTALRWPLLAAVQSAYSVRRATRVVRGRER